MTHRDDSGNVQVDFVWGNIPMQPDTDRTDMYIYTAGDENVGWSGTETITSDTLRTSDYNVTRNNLNYKVPADSHTIATTGYSNFPGYIENYAGDGDSALEAIVPNVVRMMKNPGRAAIEAANLDYSNEYVNPEIYGVVSEGTTIRMFVDNLYGLKVGDQVWPDNNFFNYGEQQVTITKTVDDVDKYFEFVTETAPDPALNDEVSGTVWPGDNVYNVILQQGAEPGTILDEGTTFDIVMLGD